MASNWRLTQRSATLQKTTDVAMSISVPCVTRCVEVHHATFTPHVRSHSRRFREMGANDYEPVQRLLSNVASLQTPPRRTTTSRAASSDAEKKPPPRNPIRCRMVEARTQRPHSFPVPPLEFAAVASSTASGPFTSGKAPQPSSLSLTISSTAERQSGHVEARRRVAL